MESIRSLAQVTSGFVLMLVLVLPFPVIAKPALTDAEVRERIIQDSQRGYSGNCPCPYNLMRNGRECGGRSAFSRPGGAAPLCYPKDVTDDMVRSYRKRNGP